LPPGRRIVLGLLALTVGVSQAGQTQAPPAVCLDRAGQPISVIVDNTIPFAAEATSRDGHRVILWNSHDVGRAPRTMALFIFLHECAHHNLNHLVKGESRSIEDQADCWAYQLIVDGDMMNGSELNELDLALKRSTGDVNHLAGEALLRSVQSCVRLRTDETAWDSALTLLTTAAEVQFRDVQGPRIPDASGQVYETTVGTPGTFDCELLQPPAVRCMLLKTRKEKAAEKRFEELEQIIRRWLSADWTSTDPSPAPGGLMRAFIAQNGSEGTTVVLGLTPDARVYFLVKPTAGS